VSQNHLRGVCECVLLCLLLIGTVGGKPQAPASPAQPSSGKSLNVRFTGEVTHGQRFEKTIAPGMVFRLEPYAGSDPGWSIRLEPSSEPSPESIDCIAPTEETAHGSNELALDPPERIGEDAELKRLREFGFIPTPSQCKVAWDLMNLALYGSKLTDKEREEAEIKLSKIPSGTGTFKVVDDRLSVPSGKDQPVAIDWLKFEVEFRFPPPPVGGSPQ
jgi:hypothetical protein